jgi:hypothetical protein
MNINVYEFQSNQISKTYIYVYTLWLEIYLSSPAKYHYLLIKIIIVK